MGRELPIAYDHFEQTLRTYRQEVLQLPLLVSFGILTP